MFLLWIVCACNWVCAQTTYMGVTLDRGKDLETNCIYIFNDNADSVRVVIQYKIGNRSTNWIDYPISELIPPSINGPQKIGCIDSTIIGLKLVDVKIVKDQFIIEDEYHQPETHKNGVLQKVKSWFFKN